MNRWYLSDWGSLDCETTGLSVEDDRIVQAGIAWCNRGGAYETRTLLADAGGATIPAEAFEIHGFQTAYVHRIGRPVWKVAQTITALLARMAADSVPLVVANAPYDLTMIDRELARNGLPSLLDQVGNDLHVLDPLVLDRAMDRFRPGRRRLQDLCEVYDVEHRTLHRADADAEAAATVTFRIISEYPELREMDLPTLHKQQAIWAAEQAGNRARRHGTPVDGRWPMIPRQAGAR